MSCRVTDSSFRPSLTILYLFNGYGQFYVSFLITTSFSSINQKLNQKNNKIHFRCHRNETAENEKCFVLGKQQQQQQKKRLSFTHSFRVGDCCLRKRTLNSNLYLVNTFSDVLRLPNTCAIQFSLQFFCFCLSIVSLLLLKRYKFATCTTAINNRQTNGRTIWQQIAYIFLNKPEKQQFYTNLALYMNFGTILGTTDRQTVRQTNVQIRI